MTQFESYVVYGKPNCPACDEAKLLIELKGYTCYYNSFGKDYDMAHLMEVASTLGVRPGSFPFIVGVTDNNVDDKALTLAELKEILK